MTQGRFVLFDCKVYRLQVFVERGGAVKNLIVS